MLTTKNVYDKFNGFFTSKDSTPIDALIDEIEIYSSKIFGDGRIYIGANAPNKMREDINRYQKSKKNIQLEVKQISSAVFSGTFFCELASKEDSLLQIFINMDDGKMRCYSDVLIKRIDF